MDRSETGQDVRQKQTKGKLLTETSLIRFDVLGIEGKGDVSVRTETLGRSLRSIVWG